ncbi:MAG: tetratricopeptide repeat protein [Bacteroidales bacterium]
MKRSIYIIIVILFVSVSVTYGQSERKAIRQGNKEFKNGDYLDSEISYRTAIDKNPESFKGSFNLGDALYKQEKYDEAAQIFDDITNLDIDSKKKAKVFHNLGNSLFKQENYAESIEAYKNALRQNPNDVETKHNLAQAQRMLKNQEEQQDSDSDGDGDDEDDDQNDNQQEQDNEDEGDDNQQEKDNQDEGDDNQQDQEDPNDPKNQQDQEQQISPEDARRMLEAIQNNEKEVQERVKEEKAKQAKIKVEKNW